MGDEGGQPDSGLLWRHPGAEVPGKERWWYWAPLPSVRHVRETDYRREPAQLALRKGKCWDEVDGGEETKRLSLPAGGRGCPPGSRRPLLIPSLPLWPHPRRGAHITGVSREPSLHSPLCLALCARLAGQGPSVRDLATSPLWQRVREGGGIISVREGSGEAAREGGRPLGSV